MSEWIIDPDASDAVVEVCYAYVAVEQARTLPQQAFAMTRLHDAIAALSTWLPTYNPNTGDLSDW